MDAPRVPPSDCAAFISFSIVLIGVLWSSDNGLGFGFIPLLFLEAL